MALEVVLAAVAVAAGGIVMNVLRQRLPSRLDVATDIVGYNTFHAFDAFVYGQTFFMMTIGWCALSLAVFALITWLVRLMRVPLSRRGPLLPRNRHTCAVPPPDVLDDDGSTRGLVIWWVGRATALLAVGAVFGVIYALFREVPPRVFGRDVFAVAIGYALLVVLAAVLVTNLRMPRVRSTRTNVSAINALVACATVLGISLISHRTSVTTVSDGAQHTFEWFPLWVGIGLTALLVGLVLRALWIGRSRNREPTHVERRAVFLMAVPVFIILVVAHLPAQLTPIDYSTFEIGQRVAPVSFMQLGEFPWRDWVSIHGLFVDGLSESFGYYLVQSSEWGAAAGQTLILLPMAYVAVYYFVYRVAGASWALLAAAGLLVLQPSVVTFDLRFFATPLLLLLLWATFDRDGWAWPVTLGFALLVNAVLVPESAFVLVACATAVVVHDLYRADWVPGNRLRSFRRTSLCAAGGCAGTVLLLAILAYSGAVGAFVSYYTTFIPSHDLEGATPLLPMVLPYAYWVFAPAVGILLGALILAVKVWRRTVLATTDFVMLAGMVIALLVYQKFTARADYHIVQVYGLSLPMLVIEAWQLLRLADGGAGAALRRLWPPVARLRPAALAALIATVVTTSGALQAVPVTAATQFHVRADAEPWSSSIGYATRDDQSKYTDMRAFLATYLHPGERVFDFSNEPGLLYYELRYRPAGRYYLVADAILLPIQQEVVRELQMNRPRFVIFQDSTSYALPAWDGISNPVRHYAISQFILDNYRPFANVDGALIYAQKSLTLSDPVLMSSQLSQPVTTRDIPFQVLPCDWGYAPEYLNSPSPPPGAATDVQLQRLNASTLRLNPPSGIPWSAYRWLEVTISGPVHENRFRLRDMDVLGENRAVMFSMLAGGSETYRFPVGACAQWHGYATAPLTLTATSPADISNVQLLP